MEYKYKAEIYVEHQQGGMSRQWVSSWFCREFALRDIHNVAIREMFETRAMTVRITGINMRDRTLTEQDGMLKFAKLLLPDNKVWVDSTSIWFDYLMNENVASVEPRNIYPAREVYSLLYFHIKYLAIQMQDRVNFDSVCKTLIRRKHPVFHYIPDQQLGTALYFFAHFSYPNEMLKFRTGLSTGSGPGTAMRGLADLEEVEVGIPQEAAKFYQAVLDEWCSLYQKELRYMVDHHATNYERFWYMPLLVQDVYTKIYDGDGKFDNMDYGENEW